MIFTPIFAGILVVLNYALGLLPSMNQDILDRLTSFMNYLVPKFVALGYYYLPMSDLLFWIKAYIGVWVVVFTIKLTMRIIAITTGGIVKADKL